MNDDYSPDGTSFTTDAFIPLAILAVSLITLLGWQVSNASTNKTQLENAITRQEPAVNQSHQVQANVTKLLNDLLEAAQTDDGAKAIVAQFKIQTSATPGAAAASPAGSP